MFSRISLRLSPFLKTRNNARAFLANSDSAAARKRGPTPAKPRLVIEKAKPEEKAKIDGALIDRVVNTTVKDISYGNPALWIQENDRLSVCAKQLYLKRIGALMVKNEEGAVTGIISERDAVKAIANSDNEPGIQTVADFMTPVEKLVCVTEDFGIGACMDLMRENTIRHLPVVKSDENAIVSEQDFLGVISIKDLLLVMTEKKILPVLEWLNEERHKHEIEERSGYSE